MNIWIKNMKLRIKDWKENINELICEIFGHKWLYSDKDNKECLRCGKLKSKMTNKYLKIATFKGENEICPICKSETCLPELHEKQKDFYKKEVWL